MKRESESFSTGDADNYYRKRQTRHFASQIDGGDIVISSRDNTRLHGSRIDADGSLAIRADAIEITASSDTEFLALARSDSDLLGTSTHTKRRFRDVARGSELSGTTVILVTDHGDIELTGSRLSATESLALLSGGDIHIGAAYQQSLEESRKTESGWLHGGSLYAETDALEGKTRRSASKV